MITFILKLVFRLVAGTTTYTLIETLILSDKGTYMTARLFEILGKGKKLIVTDFEELVEHPDVDSEQFAMTVAAILSKKFDEDVQSECALAASSRDIPALKKHIKSREVQKKFFGYFGIDVLEIEAAWSTLESTLRNRHGVWRREHALRTSEDFQEIGYLPQLNNILISQYAA